VGAILLATDGSESARRAAVEAIDLAAARDVPPYVPCVVDQRRFDDPALGAAELATTDAEDHAALTVEEVTAMAADEVDATSSSASTATTRRTSSVSAAGSRRSPTVRSWSSTRRPDGPATLFRRASGTHDTGTRAPCRTDVAVTGAQHP
jgi:hypothetical protein